MKTRTIIGAVAATALIGIGAYNFTQKNNTQQAKPETEVEALRKQYEADSLDFVNSDSVKAKAKLAALKEIQKEYILGKNTINILSNDSLLKEAYEKDKQSGILNGTSYDEYKARVESLANKLLQRASLKAIYDHDSDYGYMKRNIDDAQKQIDIATGKVLKNTKEKLAQAELKEKQENAEKERKDSLLKEFDKVLAQ